MTSFCFQNAQFNNVIPPKAGNGLDGSQTGKEGGNGQTGKASPNIKIIAGQLLQGSSKKLDYNSKGGEGGNGGTGKAGTIPSVHVPANCLELMSWPGHQSSRHENDCGHPCCNPNACRCCKLQFPYWWDINTYESCGTAGKLLWYYYQPFLMPKIFKLLLLPPNPSF